MLNMRYNRVLFIGRKIKNLDPILDWSKQMNVSFILCQSEDIKKIEFCIESFSTLPVIFLGEEVIEFSCKLKQDIIENLIYFDFPNPNNFKKKEIEFAIKEVYDYFNRCGAI